MAKTVSTFAWCVTYVILVCNCYGGISVNSPGKNIQDNVVALSVGLTNKETCMFPRKMSLYTGPSPIFIVFLSCQHMQFSKS